MTRPKMMSLDCGQILQDPKTRIEHAWSGRFREGIRREDNGDGNLACCLLKPASWQAVQISIESERTPRQSCSLVYTAAQAGKIFRMKLDKHPKMW